MRRIREGRTLTYGEVAALGKSEGGAGVGAVRKTNYNPAISCHLVIFCGGHAAVTIAV